MSQPQTPLQTPPSAPVSAWFWPVVVVAAWVLPGLGHILSGSRKQGLILMGVILSLFGGGLLIGGIDVVDRRQDTLWFVMGQMHAGPLALLTAEIHANMDDQALKLQQGLESPDSKPAYVHSLGRVNEIGSLYCAVAGGLNLLAILDLIGRWPTRRRQESAT